MSIPPPKKIKKKAGISYSKATAHFDGIHVQPSTADDHRKLSRYLNEEDIHHHVYGLSHDEPYRVIIRGLPWGFSLKDVKDALEFKGIPTTELSKLKTGYQRRESHLVYVVLPKTTEAEKIYQLTDIFGLKVTVEAKNRPKKNTRQCYNCQLFGHTSSSYHAPARCVRCAGAHHLSECELKEGLI